MSKIDYRRAKIMLNKVHNFSFKMPRKGKDFTPQQKSAITRKFNQYADLIKATANEKASFISTKKFKKSEVENIEGIKTNKGIFFKYPNAEIKKDKNQIIVKTSFGKRREIYLPFPKTTAKFMDRITAFVERNSKQYAPDYVRWSVNGYKGSTLFEPEAFNLYAKDFKLEHGNKYSKTEPYFTGVFFGFSPEWDEVEEIDNEQNKKAKAKKKKKTTKRAKVKNRL